MKIKEKGKAVINQITGRAIAEQVEEYSEIVGDVVLGVERRMTSIEHRADTLGRILSDVAEDSPGIIERQKRLESGSSKTGERLTELESRIGRLQILLVFTVIVVLALAITGFLLIYSP